MDFAWCLYFVYLIVVRLFLGLSLVVCDYIVFRLLTWCLNDILRLRFAFVLFDFNTVFVCFVCLVLIYLCFGYFIMMIFSFTIDVINSWFTCFVGLCLLFCFAVLFCFVGLVAGLLVIVLWFFVGFYFVYWWVFVMFDLYYVVYWIGCLLDYFVYVLSVVWFLIICLMLGLRFMGTVYVLFCGLCCLLVCYLLCCCLNLYFSV